MLFILNVNSVSSWNFASIFGPLLLAFFDVMQKSFSPNSADASASLFSFLSARPFTHLVINPADHSTTHANDRSLDLILMFSRSSIALRAVLIRPCALQTTISILPLLCDAPLELFIGTVSPDRLAALPTAPDHLFNVSCNY